MPCHYRVDADQEAFPTDVLLAWKRDHEKRVSDLVGVDLEQSLLRLAEVRFSHDLAREFLLGLDGHRFMYFEDSRESPDYVWKAVDALRCVVRRIRPWGRGASGRRGSVPRLPEELCETWEH